MMRILGVAALAAAGFLGFCAGYRWDSRRPAPGASRE
jgi:hypothetical protein